MCLKMLLINYISYSLSLYLFLSHFIILSVYIYIYLLFSISCIQCPVSFYPSTLGSLYVHWSFSRFPTSKMRPWLFYGMLYLLLCLCASPFADQLVWNFSIHKRVHRRCGSSTWFRPLATDISSMSLLGKENSRLHPSLLVRRTVLISMPKQRVSTYIYVLIQS